MKFKKSILGIIIIMVSLMTIAGLSGLNSIIPQKQDVSGQPEDKIPEEQKKLPNMIKVSLIAEDGVKIAADLYQVADLTSGWIILVHAMPNTKESWNNLAIGLQEQGIESIAIDLRGHGESGGESGNEAKGILDVEAAAKYLVEKELASRDRISLAGASIGANLALEYASRHRETKSAVLLSPGLNYHGIEAEPLVKKISTTVKMFFVSSKDDDNNVSEVEKLIGSAPSGTIKQIYDAAGHGTDMLEKEAGLKDLIINFIKQ
ncbi:MAG: alpha/beta fold hydrolase [Candidatus Wolfebacteria bacterium]|nr:alpha/beta fold hydrolase [Candidatus Wolfebacteria bacterium]